jgi:hypothetical protein
VTPHTLQRRDYPEHHTALMEVAHRTDLLADDAMDSCGVVNTPELLGRRRWRLFDGDVEIVPPVCSPTRLWFGDT